MQRVKLCVVCCLFAGKLRIEIDATSMVSLKDIAPSAQNNINTQFIILEKSKTTTMEGQYKCCLGLVADETAAVNFQFWQDECEAFEAGDIVRLTNGIFSFSHHNNLVLRAGKKGKIEKVGEFTMVFVETPNMSKISWVRDPNNSNKYVQQGVPSASMP